jgi:endoglucanase
MTEKSLGELLELFDNVAGVSGYEGETAAVFKKEADGAYDDFCEDAVGNQIFHLKGRRDFSVLVAAHLDELGFMISLIEDSGLLRFFPIGWHDDRLVINQELAIHTKTGIIHGVTGTKPPHIAKKEELQKVVSIENMFIDVGASSKQEVQALGVEEGDVVTFSHTGHFLNNTKIYSGKSVDNRAGLAVMLDVMRRLKKEKIDNVNVYAVGTVQEEYGCRGAFPVANRIKPDVAVVLDVTVSAPCAEFHISPVRMGGGACIKFYEIMNNSSLGMAVPKKITGTLIDIAKKNNIPYQKDFMLGGITDGSTINFAANGILTCGISFATRYIHSAVALVNLDDMQASSNLLFEYIKSL